MKSCIRYKSFNVGDISKGDITDTFYKKINAFYTVIENIATKCIYKISEYLIFKILWHNSLEKRSFLKFAATSLWTSIFLYN